MASTKTASDEFTKGVRDLTPVYLLQEIVSKEKQVTYLISFELNKAEDGVTVSVTDTEEYFWRKEFVQKDFDVIRKRMGMEGSYQTYFEILKKALVEEKPPYGPEIHLEEMDCFIKVRYPISKGVTLSGNFAIESPFERKEGSEAFYKQVSRLYLSSLRFLKSKNKTLEDENKLLKVREVEAVGISKTETGFRGGITSTRPFLKEPEGPRKKKAKTDLINPNTKKRRAVGLKFEQAENARIDPGSDSD